MWTSVCCRASSDSRSPGHRRSLLAPVPLAPTGRCKEYWRRSTTNSRQRSCCSGGWVEQLDATDQHHDRGDDAPDAAGRLAASLGSLASGFLYCQDDKACHWLRGLIMPRRMNGTTITRMINQPVFHNSAVDLPPESSTAAVAVLPSLRFPCVIPVIAAPTAQTPAKIHC